MGKGLLLIPKFKRKNFCPVAVCDFEGSVFPRRHLNDPIHTHKSHLCTTVNALFLISSLTHVEVPMLVSEKYALVGRKLRFLCFSRSQTLSP